MLTFSSHFQAQLPLVLTTTWLWILPGPTHVNSLPFPKHSMPFCDSMVLRLLLQLENSFPSFKTQLKCHLLTEVFSHLRRQRYPLAPSSVNIPILSCSAIYLFAHLLPPPWVQGQCLNHFQKIVSTHKYLWSEWIDYAWYFRCLLAHLSVSSLGNVSPTLP